jgi:hypothetical protein
MTPEQHKRSTHLVRQSLLAYPIKPETFKDLLADVELKTWAKGIHK